MSRHLAGQNTVGFVNASHRLSSQIGCRIKEKSETIATLH